MRKLKDILYDYNDILIALAIMVIAALLIMWRISAIVDYPREFISDNTEVSEPAGENGESGESGEPAGDPSEPAGEEGARFQKCLVLPFEPPVLAPEPPQALGHLECYC